MWRLHVDASGTLALAASQPLASHTYILALWPSVYWLPNARPLDTLEALSTTAYGVRSTFFLPFAEALLTARPHRALCWAMYSNDATCSKQLMLWQVGEGGQELWN
jgi:hypothetical protein